MTIAPGWYVVSGTGEVRWWDGAKFRQVQLRDGVAHYDQFRSQSPGPSIAVGIILMALCAMRIGLDPTDPYGLVSSVALLVVAALSIVLGIRGRSIEKRPAPTTAAYADPRTMPWPGQTEPGPIAPGWYAAPSRRIPRWWSGARWGEYLILRRFPMPISGQRTRHVVAAWIVGVLFGLLTLAGVILLLVGIAEREDDMALVGGLFAAVFALLGIFLTAYLAYLVRVVTLPSTPPGMSG